jgi:hypothetical protein
MMLAPLPVDPSATTFSSPPLIVDNRNDPPTSDAIHRVPQISIRSGLPG